MPHDATGLIDGVEEHSHLSLIYKADNVNFLLVMAWQFSLPAMGLVFGDRSL